MGLKGLGGRFFCLRRWAPSSAGSSPEGELHFKASKAKRTLRRQAVSQVHEVDSEKFQEEEMGSSLILRVPF